MSDAVADLSLIGLFMKDRNIFERHERMIPEHLLESGTKVVLGDIRAWYQRKDAGNIATEISSYWEWVKFQRHPTYAEKKLLAMKTLIKRSIQQMGSKNANELLQVLVLRDYAGKIATKADKFSSGETDFDFFTEIMDDVDAAKLAAGIHTDNTSEVRTPLAELLDRIRNPLNGMSWRLPHLNDAVGPLRKGDLITIAAFVDSGKSTLVSSEATNFATQLRDDEVVLFFNNEEDGDKVRLRLMRSLLGWTNEQMDAMEAQADTEMRRLLHGATFDERIILIDNAIITPGLIRQKLRKYKTKLMVFDQLYKLVGVRGSGTDDGLESLRVKYQYARQLAKEVAPVIAVHQARGDANGELFIEMHQLAGSQQAIQGEADVIITLGRDLSDSTKRGIYTPKNKSDTPGDNEMRNAKVTIYPDFPRARFE